MGECYVDKQRRIFERKELREEVILWNYGKYAKISVKENNGG